MALSSSATTMIPLKQVSGDPEMLLAGIPGQENSEVQERRRSLRDRPNGLFQPSPEGIASSGVDEFGPTAPICEGRSFPASDASYSPSPEIRESLKTAESCRCSAGFSIDPLTKTI